MKSLYISQIIFKFYINFIQISTKYIPKLKKWSSRARASFSSQSQRSFATKARGKGIYTQSHSPFPLREIVTQLVSRKKQIFPTDSTRWRSFPFIFFLTQERIFHTMQNKVQKSPSKSERGFFYENIARRVSNAPDDQRM